MPLQNELSAYTAKINLPLLDSITAFVGQLRRGRTADGPAGHARLDGALHLPQDDARALADGIAQGQDRIAGVELADTGEVLYTAKINLPLLDSITAFVLDTAEATRAQRGELYRQCPFLTRASGEAFGEAGA